MGRQVRSKLTVLQRIQLVTSPEARVTRIYLTIIPHLTVAICRNIGGKVLVPDGLLKWATGSSGATGVVIPVCVVWISKEAIRSSVSHIICIAQESATKF